MDPQPLSRAFQGAEEARLDCIIDVAPGVIAVRVILHRSLAYD